MSKPTITSVVASAAAKYKIPYANLRAVVEIESNGVIFAPVNGKYEPVIRFEGHIFDRRLTPQQQQIARNQGLSSPKVGGVPNPAMQEQRWNKLLIPASKINYQAAYESCSYGVGQVMGFHWEAFGYKSVDDLVDIARSGAAGQIELMLRYCLMNNLLDELQTGDFTAFARGYNGPAYKTNNYDVKMREAAIRYAKDAPEPVVEGTPIIVVTENTNMYRMGSKGRVVREIQALLLRAGMAIKIDGDYGPSTKSAVADLQMKAGIHVDGIVGPETWRVLDKYRVDGEEQPGGATVTETPEGRHGLIAGIIGAVIAAIANLTPEAAQQLVGAIGVIISVAGGLWAAYGWRKANSASTEEPN